MYSFSPLSLKLPPQPGRDAVLFRPTQERTNPPCHITTCHVTAVTALSAANAIDIVTVVTVLDVKHIVNVQKLPVNLKANKAL